MVVVIDRQQDFAVHLVAVALDVILSGLRQLGEIAPRIDTVETIDETPDLGAFANEFVGVNAKTVDGTFVEVGFDEEHGLF